MQRHDIDSPSSLTEPLDSTAGYPTKPSTDDPTTLILVRHGETAWNRIKRMQGQIDIPLSDVGVAQADLLARRVARERVMSGEARVRDPLTLSRIDAVVSSDLSRAMQTALPIAAAVGCEVVPDVALRERHYGVFQGHDSEQVRAQWPEAHARWIGHDADFAPEGGESLRQLSLRVRQALSAIARRYPGKTVVCVAHGGVLDVAYRFAEGLPLDTPRQHLLLNASANTIAWHRASAPDDDRATMLLWGDVRHLTEAAGTPARDDE